jgi:tetraacyldisaccharide 4'-kinase
MRALLEAGGALYGAAWEARRRAYAAGWKRTQRVGARVVSVGNLTVGGTGKTTLTLHLARVALAAGVNLAVVTRRYRPGPQGRGDEELLYASALGEARVHAGDRKLDLAERAAAAGRDLVLVDDGFSHWALARDLDVVLLDAGDALGGGRLLPAGRLREPWRALQRAECVVISRLPVDADPQAWIERARPWAPAARFAAGRHRVTGVRRLDGGAEAAEGPARVVTATGNPAAIARSAAEAGFTVGETAAYRDHHWFTEREAAAELAAARRAQATLVITAKDAVRWPAVAADPRVRVLEAAWEWRAGGEALERLVVEGDA